MKRQLFYLLPFLLVFAFGCAPKINAPPPANAPIGTFTGQFKLLHHHPKSGVTDTMKANLTLNMEIATGFKVTGDTATVHAGSYGSYVVSTPTSQIQFYDKTFPANGIAAKAHLDGIYSYLYDGTTLQLATFGAQDTLYYYYKLTKTGN